MLLCTNRQKNYEYIRSLDVYRSYRVPVVYHGVTRMLGQTKEKQRPNDPYYQVLVKIWHVLHAILLWVL